MGLDIFDALSAAGAGVGAYAQAKDTKRKEELAQKLELEREQRAEERQISREQREEKRRDQELNGPPELFQKDGVWFERGVNRKGDPLWERLANPQRVQELDFQNRFNEAKLKGAGLDAQLAEAKLNYLPQEESLDAEYKRSGIAENIAQAEAARANARRADRPDPKEQVDTSLGSLTNRLLDESKDLKDQYADDINATEWRTLATAAIKAAAASHQDVRVIFPKVIREYLTSGKKPD